MTGISRIAQRAGLLVADLANGVQATDINTAVEVDAKGGNITTQSASTGIGSSDSFTVNNDRVKSVDDVVLLAIQSYSGTLETNGLPIAVVTNVAVGSFQVTIMNVDGANALSGTFILNFAVINNG